jgi:predicted alpha/beta-fold hydrolase
MSMESREAKSTRGDLGRVAAECRTAEGQPEKATVNVPSRSSAPPAYEFPEFVPHPLLRSGHAQTFAGAYVPHRRVAYRAQCHTLHLPDGDRTALHDDLPEGWSDGQPCVLLLHGLGGSHLSPYMVRVSDKLRRRGVRAFRLDLRGHGAAWDWAQYPGHAGRSEDARAAIELIQRLAPRSTLSAVGISLGGNILLKLLGEWGGDAPAHLIQALIVSPPADLAHCSRNMLNEVSPLYTRAFLRSLRRQMRLRKHIMPGLAQLKLPRDPENLWEFDDWVTAPLSGFKNAVEYYEHCSSCHVAHQVQVPTTMLAAADDPIIPVGILETITLSNSTRLHITEHGGHIGFIGESGRDPDRRWLDWRILEWLDAGMRTGISTIDPVR